MHLTTPCLSAITTLMARSAETVLFAFKANYQLLQAHFNVFSSPKAGQAWGTFTTDTEFPEDFRGPSYHEEVPGNPLSASKVSTVGGSSKWDTVLLARLRFKPDVLEPTSL
jgi:hypothetical protein